MLNREKIKLSDQHRGIKYMKKLPNAIVIVDGKTESIAIQEAKKLEIPIICIVDSNTDPSLCDYPIPANDDSIRTIQLIVNEIVNTIISVSKKDDDKSESASDVKEQKEG
jgi:small subunit ribosomal protein S2